MTDPSLAKYEPVFCGDTKVRLGTLDGAMVLEVWVPMPGAPEGELWLGYTGALPVPDLTVSSFTDQRSPAGEPVEVTYTVPPATYVCHPGGCACFGDPNGTGPTPVW